MCNSFISIAALVSVFATTLVWSSNDALPADQPIELFAFGDDEFDFVLFDQTANPLVPTRMRFVGIAERHLPFGAEPTSAYFAFVTDRLDGGAGFLGPPTDFIPLPSLAADGAVVPVSLDLSLVIPFSPAFVGFYVEGGGPGDQTIVRGTFSYNEEPEPNTMAMIVGGALGIPAWSRRKRTASKSIHLVIDA